MRLYVKIEGEARERLERRAVREGPTVRLRELVERLIAEKLADDEHVIEHPRAEVA